MTRAFLLFVFIFAALPSAAVKIHPYTVHCSAPTLSWPEVRVIARQLTKHVRDLPRFETDALSFLIQNIIKIPEEGREDFLNLLWTALPDKRSDYYTIKNVFEVLREEVPQEQWRGLQHDLKQLRDYGYKFRVNKDLIKECLDLAPNYWHQYSGRLGQIYGNFAINDISIRKLAAFVEALQDLTRGEVDELLRQAVSAIRPQGERSKNDLSTLHTAMMALIKHEGDDRKEVLARAEALFSENMVGHYPMIDTKPLELASTIPVAEWEDVLMLARDIRPVPASDYWLADFVQAVAAIDLKDREVVLKRAKPLMEKYPENSLLILSQVRKIPSDDWASVLTYAEPLFEINPEEVHGILRSVSEIPITERETVVRRVQPILVPKYEHISLALLAARNATPQDWEDTLGALKTLGLPENTGYILSVLYDALQDVPSGERRTILEHVKTLYESSGEYRKLEAVVKALRHFDLEGRKVALRRASNFQDTLKNPYEIPGLLMAVGSMSEQEWSGVLHLAHYFNKAFYSTQSDGIFRIFNAEKWQWLIEMSEEERQATLDSVQQLIAENRRFFGGHFTVENMLEIKGPLSSQDWENLRGWSKHFSSVFQAAGESGELVDTEFRMRIMGLILDESQESILENINGFFLTFVPEAWRVKILKEFMDFPPTDIFETVKSLNTLFNMVKGACDNNLDARTTVEIVRAMGRIPTEEQTLVLGWLRPVVNKTFDANFLPSILEPLAELECPMDEVLTWVNSSYRASWNDSKHMESFCDIIQTVPLRLRSLFNYCQSYGDMYNLSECFRCLGQNPRLHEQFYQEFVRLMNAEQERRLASGEKMINDELFVCLTDARDIVTQRNELDREEGDFYGLPAFQIHNAVQSLVTRKGGQKPLYKALEDYLQHDLKIVRVPLQTAAAELTSLANTMDVEHSATEVAETSTISAAIAKAYGEGDAQYSGEITRLLGLVWPYMQTLPDATRREWLSYAVAESQSAYGAGGSLSCAKGIQERLTVTGFLDLLDGVDPTLKALSFFAQTTATPDITFMVMEGSQYLASEMRAAIAAVDDPTMMTKQRLTKWVEAAVRAWAANVPLFNDQGVRKSDGFNLPEDLMRHKGIQKNMTETVVPKFLDDAYWECSGGFRAWQKMCGRVEKNEDAHSEDHLAL